MSVFRARESLEKADVIISNLDLLLSDLALGGEVILPEPASCIYIIDEAHHLLRKPEITLPCTRA